MIINEIENLYEETNKKLEKIEIEKCEVLINLRNERNKILKKIGIEAGVLVKSDSHGICTILELDRTENPYHFYFYVKTSKGYNLYISLEQITEVLGFEEEF